MLIPSEISLNRNQALVCTVNSINVTCYSALKNSTYNLVILKIITAMSRLTILTIKNVMNPLSLSPTNIFALKII